MPGIATSRSRQLVSPTTSEARNASADENAWAAKPNCRSKSGSDSRTDSSSSTIDTSERLLITQHSMRHSAGTVYETLVLVPQYGCRVALWTVGNGKREGGTGSVVRLYPQTATMSLDYRAADRQPDTHAAALRRVERIE